jgi:hypothetical protein
MDSSVRGRRLRTIAVGRLDDSDCDKNEGGRGFAMRVLEQGERGSAGAGTLPFALPVFPGPYGGDRRLRFEREGRGVGRATPGFLCLIT